ncbi:MAG: AAA family ATPase [Proteobacteria bacterium]|nr:AAA family ATPase [Pseudomonadota bacterium]MBU1648353.1 AAA family ATPase [Pseudomonadota bacterium]MBU1986760.1 AAA family ATPase [Pseudomonadota bacterium]
MYATLLERHKGLGDILETGETLWTDFNASKSLKIRAWAVPLDMADEMELVAFCAKSRIEPEDVDPFLATILSAVDLAEGEMLALMTAGDVRAVGTVTSTEGGEFSWDQIPLEPFPSGLLVAPQFEVKELTAAEREEIWSHVPKQEEFGASTTGPRYWKIAPGRNAVGWPEWRDKGIASIGWPELGDLTGLSKSEFDIRANECLLKFPDGYKKRGMGQVWTFRGIKPGDKIVANDGKSVVVGIGTVVNGYSYAPNSSFVEGEDYCHQIGVYWESQERRKVNRPDWFSTLKNLSEEDYNEILSAPQVEKTEPEGETLEEIKTFPPPIPCNPQNIILYGPPGTGKTFTTARRALQLILPEQNLDDLSDETVMRVFREKQAQGQAEFVTFHQSYGYEEFVEGLRPVLDAAEEGGEVKYELHDGVFKRIALRAAAEGLLLKDETPGFDTLWAQLLLNVEGEEERLAKSISNKDYVLRISSRGNLQIYPCTVEEDGTISTTRDSGQTAGKELVRLLWDNRNELGPKPEELTTNKTTEFFGRTYGNAGGHQYTALWIAYKELYTLSMSAASRRLDLVAPAARVQQVLDKPSAGGASFSFSADTRQYVLIIDEINRGNISKILGELITILEPDKRLGTPGELKLPLSYSPTHRFAVPPNLHVIGTMNTADRSIALMDVALRRRFTFEELMPDAGIIRQVLQKQVTSKPLIDLIVDVFEALNARIRFIYDRDHQLGHAYFLGVRSLEDLRRVFVERVIPLLQEYFYGAWDKICLVLGCPYTEEGLPERNGSVVKDKAYVAPIISATTFEEEATIGFDHSDYENRLDHCISSRFTRGNDAEVLVPFFLGVLPDKQYEGHKTAFEVVS